MIRSVSSRSRSAASGRLGCRSSLFWSTNDRVRTARAERSDGWLFAGALAVALFAAGCAPLQRAEATPTPTALPPVVPGLVDCGSFDAGHDEYDRAGHECVWRAYTSGSAVSYRLTVLTIEGDPIPMTLLFEPGRGVTVAHDLSADEFTSPASRRLWSWRCSAMTQRMWVTDASRYSFELTGCTGDGRETHFP